MQWIALSDRKPPEYAAVIFGWWCYFPDSISWEYADDQPGCATHWCALPREPRPDPSKIPDAARAA